MTRYVIAGHVDSEDGTLYWNDDDGWGFLSTASTFNQVERNELTLPAGDPGEDEPRWVALP